MNDYRRTKITKLFRVGWIYALSDMYNIKLFCRADYIALFSHSTLSLEAMANLNSDLRQLVFDDYIQKQEHVRYILDTTIAIFDSIINIIGVAVPF